MDGFCTLVRKARACLIELTLQSTLGVLRQMQSAFRQEGRYRQYLTDDGKGLCPRQRAPGSSGGRIRTCAPGSGGRCAISVSKLRETPGQRLAHPL